MAFNLKEMIFGSGPKYQQVDRFKPQQNQMQQMLLSQLMQAMPQGFEYLQNILSDDPDAMQQFEAPMMQQFERDVLPTISERFAGMGSGGAQDSSGFQQTLGQAGKDLSTQLAQLRAQLKGQAMGQLSGMTGQGFTPSFETTYQQPQMGLLGGLLGGLGQGAGKSAVSYFLN